MAESPLPEVVDLRVLWLRAIDSPSGVASGVFVSPEARAIARSVKADAPLRVDVTTLAVYRQEGCRRLQMTIRASGATVGASAAPHEQQWVYGFDYCRDGTPPRSKEVR